MRRITTSGLIPVLLAVLSTVSSVGFAQDVGRLVSPGPLSSAHAKLEGIKNCTKCHDPGEGVTAAKCLDCHQPIARRIEERRGVHREVTDECAVCHAEHAGRDADIRPLDAGSFDHLEETGFPLDGRHASLGGRCEKCHTTRSFLTSEPNCNSCHKDTMHQGTLGTDCAVCHTTAAGFRETGLAFDHVGAAFPLAGAHATVQCASCHKDRKYRGLRYQECGDCHRDPHEAAFGAVCSSCHTPEAWASRKVDHARTGFPLEGLHATVECMECHRQPAAKVQLQHDRCSDCHSDPHQGLFPEDCAACHNVSGFKGAAFDHALKTPFALLDRHAEIDCVACHKQPAQPGEAAARAVEFRGLSSECATCHSDAHTGSLGTQCASCHSTRSFRISAFEHPRNRDFFAGGHTAVPCAKCHRDVAELESTDTMVSSRVYRGLSIECASCHDDIHLGQLGADCAVCHTVDAPKFAAARFDHGLSGFALDGRHGTIECVQCHKRETGDFVSGHGTAVRYKGMRNACVSCHKDIHLGQLGTRCASCHGTESFEISTHEHKAAGDFFTGHHGALECRQCHRLTTGDFPAGHGEAVQFAGLDRTCATCHDDMHQGTLGVDCASCHAVQIPFKNQSRAFHKSGLFPLEGRHLAVPCASCHLDGVIEGTPTRCSDCHWIRRQDDPFRTRLGNECENCHRPISWTAVTWEHETNAGFEIGPQHATVGCEGCHPSRRFDIPVSPDCFSCHGEDYRGAKNPDHVAAGFPTDCTVCHMPNHATWRQGEFNHAFRLVGNHATTECDSCHSSGVYAGLPSDCVDCHLTDYDTSNEPRHPAAGFSTECDTCHRPSDPDWLQATYPHSVWPLVGAHTGRTCGSCHTGEVYSGLPSDCVDCHLPDFNSTSNPDHPAAGFPTDCETCHTPTSWEGAEFAHPYQLVGAHATADCASCHSSGVYAGLPSDCVDCHLADFDASIEPRHPAAGFSTDCETCHRASDPDWMQAAYPHSVWPLVGAHTGRTCGSCHTGEVYSGLPSDCVDCHLADYNATDDPNHTAAGFPTDCETCHDPASWEGAVFVHTYQLLGAHATADCDSCHSSGVYAGLPSDCVDCHLADYNATNDPSHSASGFPTDCETCHDPASWEGAEFIHPFQLVGAHATADCDSCHSSGVYAGLPSDCVDCHLADFDASIEPRHPAAGFSTDCETCHTASDPDWLQASYPHSVWPLVGSHTAQNCGSCHTADVYAGLPNDCVDCHLADYDSTDDPDHAATGFSTDCQICHQPTSWEGAEFIHPYNLVGAHATLDCDSCHGGGVYAGTPTDCVGCHLEDYNSADDPNHPAAGFSTDCETCHQPTSWDNADFVHTYRLEGRHASLDCNRCHGEGVYSGLPSDCVDCHIDNYRRTDDPDHAAAGFPTTCDDCHRARDSSWDQGVFNHTAFPIPHRDADCEDCHTNPSMFAAFSCISGGCHSFSDWDDEHDEGDPYESGACYSCHPDGRAEDDKRLRMRSSHARN